MYVKFDINDSFVCEISKISTFMAGAQSTGG